MLTGGCFRAWGSGDIQSNLTNQRPPFRIRLLLPPGLHQSETSIQGNLAF